jgi:nitronate monooxygenase
MPADSLALPERLSSRLRLPLIAAPMLRVSGPELVIAACRAGVIGAFPTANARSVDMLDDWLTQMGSSGASAPHCANLIIRQPRLAQHLDRLIAHRVELVITSVGAPDPVLEPLHEIGCLVFADVATVNHARKAVAAGSTAWSCSPPAQADKPDGSTHSPSHAPSGPSSTVR